MKSIYLALAAILATLAGSSSPAASNPSDVKFRIEMRVESGNLSMQCTSGCVWETLTVECGDGPTCQFVLDQNGMGR
jgi:hypothetical protein